MQTTLAVENITLTIPELLATMSPGDEVVLTRNQLPVAIILSEVATLPQWQRPGPGLCKGMIAYMAPDFDAQLEDMKEYMQ